jgi:hypothetical protein
MSTNVKSLWVASCLPAKVFPLVMAGVALFNLWRGVWREAARDLILGVFGTAALWFLCTSGMEMIAYLLLAVPVIFVIFLSALLVFDQTLIAVTRDYDIGNRWSKEESCDDCNSCKDYTC